MINGFFKVVQRDIDFLVDYPSSPSKEQEEKVVLVATRLFAVLGMALSIVVGLRSFAADTVMRGMFKLASAVALYTFSHDFFVMSVNSEKRVDEHLLATAKGMVKDLSDIWKGKKKLDDAPRHPFAEGTFYRPMWDASFAKK